MPSLAECARQTGTPRRRRRPDLYADRSGAGTVNTASDANATPEDFAA